MRLLVAAVLVSLAWTACSGKTESAAPFATTAVSPELAARRVACVRPIEVTFNTASHGGKLMASAAFRFVYDRDPDSDAKLRGQIDNHWDAMMLRVMDLLLSRGADDLVRPAAIDRLSAQLQADISAILFPQAAAQVVEILWERLVIL